MEEENGGASDADHTDHGAAHAPAPSTHDQVVAIKTTSTCIATSCASVADAQTKKSKNTTRVSWDHMSDPM